MTWKTELKKEKFQGPQRQFAGVSMITKWGRSNSKIDSYLKAIEREVEKDSDIKPPITSHLSEIRRLVDEADNDLIELAKYGGQNIEPRQDRVDEKNIWLHSGKFGRR